MLKVHKLHNHTKIRNGLACNEREVKVKYLYNHPRFDFTKPNLDS